MGSTKSPLATSSEEEVEVDDEHQHSDETTTENEEEVHGEEEEEHNTEDAHTETSSSEEGGHQHHAEEEEVPVEQKLRQLTDGLGKLGGGGNTLSSNDDENRQSFLSLSDLIKTLRPNDDKPLQIDSSYSRSQVLGEKPDIIYHPRNAASGGDIANRSLFKKK